VTPGDAVARVRYWVFNYAPQWEAVSKEIASLLEGLSGVESSLISLNTSDPRLRWNGRLKRVPLPHGLPLYPLLRREAGRSGVNHLFASAGERWLSRLLTRHKSVLTIAKGTASLERVERNVTALRSFRAIVVQSDRDRDLMRQLGVAETAVHLIRPGIPPATYREAQGPFTILFASSPLSAGEFLSRGIHLMVRAAERLPEVRFLLVWRRRHVDKLRQLIAEAAVSNIEVHDGVVRDMGALYDRAHATALPALEHRSFVPAPRSGLESLAHGKPLLLSGYVAIAGSVAGAGAAVVFEPTVEGLVGAIGHLRKHYSDFQQAAQPYLREHFSASAHLELHRRLYESLGG
jgi:glycosyltransferase involved in cell wall biosynthesis